MHYYFQYKYRNEAPASLVSSFSSLLGIKLDGVANIYTAARVALELFDCRSLPGYNLMFLSYVSGRLSFCKSAKSIATGRYEKFGLRRPACDEA